ncbi:hypothetical protein ACHRV5_03110 [Flavobacterium sp. FlaQc-52]
MPFNKQGKRTYFYKHELMKWLNRVE